MFNRKAYMEEYYQEHKEDIKAYQKQYHKNNPECSKQYRINNKERRNTYNKQWYKDNKERKKVYYFENEEKIKEYNKRYYQEHKKDANKYVRNRYKTDLRFNLNRRMANAIWFSIKNNKNGRKWETLVGYNVDDLIKCLKKTMPKGYTWQDYLEGKLHIDHIIPIDAFNFDKPEHSDFSRCWALSNLQFLPARENRVKHNKLYKSFQPALAI